MCALPRWTLHAPPPHTHTRVHTHKQLPRGLPQAYAVTLWLAPGCSHLCARRLCLAASVGCERHASHRVHRRGHLTISPGPQLCQLPSHSAASCAGRLPVAARSESQWLRASVRRVCTWQKCLVAACEPEPVTLPPTDVLLARYWWSMDLVHLSVSGLVTL